MEQGLLVLPEPLVLLALLVNLVHLEQMEQMVCQASFNLPLAL